MDQSQFHPLEAASRQRRTLLRVVRMGFFILIVTVALVTMIQEAQAPGDAAGLSALPWWMPVAMAVVFFGVALVIDLLTPNKKISTISGVFLGLLAGMLATIAFSLVIDLALQVWLEPRALEAEKVKAGVGMMKMLLGMCLCYLGITTVLQTQDDFRLVIPYVEFAKQIRGTKPLILDTSALIDARIADVAATGLLQAPLIIPRFVIAELQLLADSSDRLKRTRGRRGLDIVGRLQRQGTIDVTIDDVPVGARAVDQMLVEMAQTTGGRLVTTDLGLTRVAQIHGVHVLNLHEIANSFKPALVPGEQVVIELVKPGEQAGQGVGYLDDGTMVVAEGGARFIGQEVLLLVTSTLQTSAGRLVFARPIQPEPTDRRLDESGIAAALGNVAAKEPATLPAGQDPESVPTGDDAGASEEEPVAGVSEEASASERPESPGVAASGAVAETRPRSGPFPPKPPARRPPSPRNPRR